MKPQLATAQTATRGCTERDSRRHQGKTQLAPAESETRGGMCTKPQLGVLERGTRGAPMRDSRGYRRVVRTSRMAVATGAGSVATARWWVFRRRVGQPWDAAASASASY